MWLQLMWLQFELVRGPVRDVWDQFGGRFGALWHLYQETQIYILVSVLGRFSAKVGPGTVTNGPGFKSVQ